MAKLSQEMKDMVATQQCFIGTAEMKTEIYLVTVFTFTKL